MQVNNRIVEEKRLTRGPNIDTLLAAPEIASTNLGSEARKQDIRHHIQRRIPAQPNDLRMRHPNNIAVVDRFLETRKQKK